MQLHGPAPDFLVLNGHIGTRAPRSQAATPLVNFDGLLHTVEGPALQPAAPEVSWRIGRWCLSRALDVAAKAQTPKPVPLFSSPGNREREQGVLQGKMSGACPN